MLRHLHALALMDRLIRWGMPRSRALAIGCWWERRIHPVLYGSGCGIGANGGALIQIPAETSARSK